MQTEALFVAGYVLALLVIAALLDVAARASHIHMHRAKTIGFHYREHIQSWECSEGTLLTHHSTDHGARLIRFRADAKRCNQCKLKELCTDSDEGRELVRPLDAWPHSEFARFQRAVSLSLVALAGLFCSIEVVRQSHPQFQAAFAGALVFCFLLGRRELNRLRAVKTVWSGSGQDLPGPQLGS